NGDFAFSAESGTVWMYDQNWYNSGDIVPDQVTPASDATPLADSGTGVAGTSNKYSRGDHKHPLQVSTSQPSKNTSVGNIGSASTYARTDHQHPILTADSTPPADTADGSYGTVAAYARNNHSHPINVYTNASIVPVVIGVRNNGISAYFSRHDHIHRQQQTQDGTITATKFIKTGGLASEILCVNGDTIDGVVDIASNQTITGTDQKILLSDESTAPLVLAQREYYITDEFTCNCRSGFGLLQFNQSYSSEGIRTQQYKFQSNMNYGMDACYIIYFGTGAERHNELWARLYIWSNQVIIKQTNQCLATVTLANVLNIAAVSALPTGYSNIADADNANRGLITSVDGNTLSFNSIVIARTGATNGATNGSVIYSADSPILWGVKSVGTEGGFCSDGAKVYWRAKSKTLRSIPP
ncbi:MAG: hypothetical protein EZS28_004883, partial [Streblomastix strix]